jgi:hypothetical protein
MEMLAHLKSQGTTIWQVLDALALSHGLHATDQVSVRVTSTEQVVSDYVWNSKHTTNETWWSIGKPD